MSGKLDGKVAFITGAARGQGRAHAMRFAAEGADIIAIDIAEQLEFATYPTSRAEDLEETVRQVEALGRRIVTDFVDVRDFDGLKRTVDRGVDELGRLDIIIANAGVTHTAPWHEVTPAIAQELVDINLMGVFNTAMAGVHHLIKAGGGSIIMTSSSTGLRAIPFLVPYTMAKYGVQGLAKALALELAKDNVRVNSIHPGAVETGMAVNAPELFQKAGAENPLLMGLLQAPMPGFMQPEEIANAALWLVSDEAKWVTGHTMAVDGGQAIA